MLRLSFEKCVCLVMAIGVSLAALGCQGDDVTDPEPNTLEDYLPIGEQRNVIVISFDALRPDALGAYGYKRRTSPNIDEFAESALVFENAITAGKDTPTSFASAFTAELPFRVFRGWRLIHVPTMAQSFQDAGYHTAGFMHNVQLTEKRGFQQGFETYKVLHSRRVSDMEVVEKVADWLSGRGGDVEGPLMLWVHFISPHAPYEYREIASPFYEASYRGPFEKSSGAEVKPADVANEADKQRVRDLYDGEVRYADHVFGELVGVLRKFDLWDNSIVALTADHGEAFGEHGTYAHGTVYGEVIRIPLMIRHPMARKSGRIEMPVSNIDLFPTLASLASVPHPKYMDGTSLVRSPWPGRPLVSVAMTQRTDRAFSVRVRNAKLIARCNIEGRVDGVELYELTTDPKELNDLSEVRGDLLEELMGHLRDLAGTEPCVAINEAVQGKSIREGLDEERLEELRSLGYIQ